MDIADAWEACKQGTGDECEQAAQDFFDMNTDCAACGEAAFQLLEAETVRAYSASTCHASLFSSHAHLHCTSHSAVSTVYWHVLESSAGQSQNCEMYRACSHNPAHRIYQK